MEDDQAVIKVLDIAVGKDEDRALIHEFENSNQRKNVGRRIAAEWCALMDWDQVRFAGLEIPFHHWTHIPSMVKELSEMIMVSRWMIARWRYSDDEFIELVAWYAQRLSTQALLEKRSDVDSILVARAMSGDTKAMILFYAEVEKREKRNHGWSTDLWDGVESNEDLIASINLIVEQIKKSEIQIAEMEIVQ